MKLWPSSLRGRLVLILSALVIGGGTAGIVIYNIGEASTRATQASQALPSQSPSSSTTSTAPPGRTGTYKVTTSDGDVVLVSVAVGDPERADEITAGGSTIAGLCGISGMRSTRAMATSFMVTLELQTPVAIASNPAQGLGLTASDIDHAMYASNYSNGWNCGTGFPVGIGYVGQGLQPHTPKTYQGWWVTVPGSSNANLNVEIVTPVGRAPISDVTGNAFIKCGGSTVYVIVNGNGCG